MALSLINDLTKMIIKAALFRAVSSFMGGFGGGATGATPVVGSLGPYAVPTFHEGGIAGRSPTGSRYVHPAYFDNAPRFHSGRMPWDSGLEMPAILRKDEEVITRNDPRHMLNGGGAVQVNVAGDTIILQGDHGKDTVAMLRQELARRDAEFPTRVIKAVQEAKSRRGL